MTGPARRLATLLALALASPMGPAACAARQASVGGAEEGLASFYADRFQGRRTASGARYDRDALTCAHRTWPFGTRLRVTELEGGRAVVVTVTDRGPSVAGRVVDLSAAAARALGITEKGVARVRLERLR